MLALKLAEIAMQIANRHADILMTHLSTHLTVMTLTGAVKQPTLHHVVPNISRPMICNFHVLLLGWPKMHDDGITTGSSQKSGHQNALRQSSPMDNGCGAVPGGRCGRGPRRFFCVELLDVWRMRRIRGQECRDSSCPRNTGSTFLQFASRHLGEFISSFVQSYQMVLVRC